MPYTSVTVKPTDRWLVGLSTETKPTPDASLATHKCMESDTGNIFLWSGGQWIQTHHGGLQMPAEDPWGSTELYHIGTIEVTVVSGGAYTFAMSTPPVGHIIFKSMTLQASAGASDIHLNEDVSSTIGGTIKVPFNRNRDGGLLFPGTYTENITSSVGGTENILGALIGGSKANIADGARQLDIRLKQNSLYTLDVHNLDNQSNNYVIGFEMGYTPT